VPSPVTIIWMKSSGVVFANGHHLDPSRPRRAVFAMLAIRLFV